MATSGLYLVSLSNIEPISVNANDPRIADRCIKVNRDNCKFGKARDLDRRRMNYCKVFGEAHVTFRPLAALTDIAAAEKAVLLRLADYRIPGTTGRKNEWLRGITPAAVESIVFATLGDGGFAFTRLAALTPD